MKKESMIRLSKFKAVALVAAVMTFGLAHNAMAAGVASGTSIDNLATLNYSVGGVAQPAIGSSAVGNSVGAGTPTTFVVDKKVNLTVVDANATFTSVTPGSTAQVTTFTVTNLGNDPQDYSLVTTNLANGTTL